MFRSRRILIPFIIHEELHVPSRSASRYRDPPKMARIVLPDGVTLPLPPCTQNESEAETRRRRYKNVRTAVLNMPKRDPALVETVTTASLLTMPPMDLPPCTEPDPYAIYPQTT